MRIFIYNKKIVENEYYIQMLYSNIFEHEYRIQLLHLLFVHVGMFACSYASFHLVLIEKSYSELRHANERLSRYRLINIPPLHFFPEQCFYFFSYAYWLAWHGRVAVLQNTLYVVPYWKRQVDYYRHAQYTTHCLVGAHSTVTYWTHQALSALSPGLLSFPDGPLRAEGR